jgi:hypothetical protein
MAHHLPRSLTGLWVAWLGFLQTWKKHGREEETLSAAVFPWAARLGGWFGHLDESGDGSERGRMQPCVRLRLRRSRWP